ncbi:MAG: 4-hydroxybenzoyl-CoA thioesterase [Yoonia sp.]|jgi:4-hydroxybenzoyl-CoA thioesterase
MFEMKQKVLFKHCDPAGIVFYPRYFEMMNDCVEAFFDDVLHWPFETFHKNGGIPTAVITTTFTAPSRHGDRLVLRLIVKRIGRASIDYRMTAHCADKQRFETEATLVYVNDAGESAPIPDTARLRITDFMKVSP